MILIKLLNIILCNLAVLYAFGEEISPITRKVGQNAILDCQVNYPHQVKLPYTLLWKKDGEKIFSSINGKLNHYKDFENRISFLSENDAWQRGAASINISNIRDTDEGWYECRVHFYTLTATEFNDNNNGTWYHLIVEGGRLISGLPQNETTLEGNSVKIRCIPKKSMSTIQWYKYGIPFGDHKELEGRYRLVQKGLYISNTTMNDSGYYTCEVTNGRGEKETAHAYLNVQFKARVVRAPSKIYFPFGQPANLVCYYKANPDVIKVRWEKDGFLFDALNVPDVYSRKNGSLLITKIDDSHAGIYTCTPYNELGTTGPSPRMRVIVQKAPVFTVTPNMLHVRSIGESILISCEAAEEKGGKTIPVITWSKRNGVLPRNRAQVQGGNLTINNIRMSDRGTYVCTASNQVATITSQTELLVEDSRVGAPSNVTVLRNNNNNDLIVKWMTDHDKSPNLRYTVWYQLEKSKQWQMAETSGTSKYDNNERQLKITNLQPESKYNIMVLSENQQGDGIFSKTIQIRTKKSGTGNGDLKIYADHQLALPKSTAAATTTTIIPTVPIFTTIPTKKSTRRSKLACSYEERLAKTFVEASNFATTDTINKPKSDS